MNSILILIRSVKCAAGEVLFSFRHRISLAQEKVRRLNQHRNVIIQTKMKPAAPLKLKLRLILIAKEVWQVFFFLILKLINNLSQFTTLMQCLFTSLL